MKTVTLLRSISLALASFDRVCFFVFIVNLTRYWNETDDIAKPHTKGRTEEINPSFTEVKGSLADLDGLRPDGNLIRGHLLCRVKGKQNGPICATTSISVCAPVAQRHFQ